MFRCNQNTNFVSLFCFLRFLFFYSSFSLSVVKEKQNVKSLTASSVLSPTRNSSHFIEGQQRKIIKWIFAQMICSYFHRNEKYFLFSNECQKQTMKNMFYSPAVALCRLCFLIKTCAFVRSNESFWPNWNENIETLVSQWYSGTEAHSHTYTHSYSFNWAICDLLTALRYSDFSLALSFTRLPVLLPATTATVQKSISRAHCNNPVTLHCNLHWAKSFAITSFV